MSGLKEIVTLQARLYEFLAQQDEATLEALVNGTARLAVLPADEERASADSESRDGARADARPASAGLTSAPSSDPLQAAQDLSKLASPQERAIYLNAAGLPVTGLRKVAKLLGMARYSSLNRAKLTDLLVGHGAEPDTRAQVRPATRTKPPEDSAKDDPSEAPAVPSAHLVAVASRLREIETEDEGIDYLRAQHLDREDLLAVAAELQLTRVERLKQAELEKRVIKQAIGARRKFAGLRKW